jgi:hypothetical protein
MTIFQLECVPCFVSQSLAAVRLAAPTDPAAQAVALREILSFLATADWSESPPELAREVHRRIRRAVGDPDPYAAIKVAHNALAQRLLPALAQRIAAAPEPVAAALAVVMAANVIDLGINRQLDEAEVAVDLDRALAVPLTGDVAGFVAEVGAARRILYLLDNAGEVVFDRLLIERLPRGRVLLVVRGGPIINDALRADAIAAGLADLAPVIDNGDDSPGTVLRRCHAACRAAFAAADLVIAKGQGNFETLYREGEGPAAGRSAGDRPVWFLLKAKCRVVADLLGVPLGSLVIRRGMVAAGPMEVAADRRVVPLSVDSAPTTGIID